METRHYRNKLTASINLKGVLDIDSFKGCPLGIKAHGANGCYGLCYAAKISKLNGYDFSIGSRRMVDDDRQGKLFDFKTGEKSIYSLVKNHRLEWFRVGTMGDPCHSWGDTVDVCEWLCHLKTPVIVTKHWIEMSEEQAQRLSACKVIVNTSVSALDSKEELEHRIFQHKAMKSRGINSVLRLVSCRFGDTDIGRELDSKQKEIASLGKYIDNPLRIPESDDRVIRGDVLVEKIKDLNSVTSISVNDRGAYIGHCKDCPDQCGLLL